MTHIKTGKHSSGTKTTGGTGWRYSFANCPQPENQAGGSRSHVIKK